MIASGNFNTLSCTLLALSWQFTHCAAGSKVKDIGATVTRQIRSLGFPEGSGMGIFFAIGIPLDIPDRSVTFSFYFEANYLLPDPPSVAETESEQTFHRRSINRSLAYQLIESKLDGAGYPGRSCLLRSICEATVNPVGNNGLLGDIIHILFTPSTSAAENLPPEIIDAENMNDCVNFHKRCPISLLDLISGTQQ
ncbi:uncharacterized protein [Neodiprion pinetum]|uniref:Uncharacterized protein LOC107218053 n=1 Tax=Neodiprion lecontei TaxID=441921 RepID=A0ABM3GI28_NEOLC|nr:uncharacterized protein LOC124185446 [Neodiprion fabricii]XP_046488447.1 uncharacterized protein LOC124221986 [Neodiprion pinetum]XP_046599886.1 uncharacterized protein LOC107218053 [Neodiprion lecontei]